MGMPGPLSASRDPWDAWSLHLLNPAHADHRFHSMPITLE